MLITTQPPASIIAGASFGLKVAIEDPYGNLETGAANTVSLALATNPGGATLGGTLSVTTSQGKATFSGLSLTAAASGYTLQVSSTGLRAATTSSFSVTPGAPARLVLGREPPTGVTAGDAFGLTVNVDDAYGNPVAFGGNVSVAIASGPAGGKLAGQTTMTAQAGVATFAGLNIAQAGSFTIQASSGSLAVATTGTVFVTPAAPSQLVVTAQPPASVSAGSGFRLERPGRRPIRECDPLVSTAM